MWFLACITLTFLSVDLVAKTGIRQASSGHQNGAIIFPSSSPHNQPGVFSSPEITTKKKNFSHRLYQVVYLLTACSSLPPLSRAVNSPRRCVKNHTNNKKTFCYLRYEIWMALFACEYYNQPEAYSPLWEARPGTANTRPRDWLNLHLINSESQSQQGKSKRWIWVIIMDLLVCTVSALSTAALQQVHSRRGTGCICQSTPIMSFCNRQFQFSKTK